MSRHSAQNYIPFVQPLGEHGMGWDVFGVLVNDAELKKLFIDTAIALGYTTAEEEESLIHTIQFRKDGWTLQHPFSCRPNLFDCPMNNATDQASLDGPPREGPGEYQAWLAKDGVLIIGSKKEPDAKV